MISQKVLELGVNRLIGEVKDVRTLDGLDASSFDVAIDKGTAFQLPFFRFSHYPGTMDAMMTSSTDVWVCSIMMNR